MTVGCKGTTLSKTRSATKKKGKNKTTPPEKTEKREATSTFNERKKKSFSFTRAAKGRKLLGRCFPGCERKKGFARHAEKEKSDKTFLSHIWGESWRRNLNGAERS